MNNIQEEIDERTNLAGNNKFELLLFRLGVAPNSDQHELFGINVFKVREIQVMPKITSVAGSSPYMLGVTNIRGQVIPIIDLSRAIGCEPKNGHNILLVTEYARTTQGFAVEDVDEIVRLEWKQVLSAENTTDKLITSIARLDGDTDNSRLAQVLDVEQILYNIFPKEQNNVVDQKINGLGFPQDALLLAADDSALARSLIEKTLVDSHINYKMTKTGLEAWNQLNSIYEECQKNGISIEKKVAMILTDLEMPEMDGFTLTKKIKEDSRFKHIPVVIHSSLSGNTNEEHVKNVGADAYIAKFVANDLIYTLQKTFNKS